MGQLGIRRVSPYSVIGPVEGSMFFGRKAELKLLAENRETNFAVVGSSRIGKSSLLKQYRSLSVREGWPDPTRIFFIDMYSYVPRKESVFKQVAMSLSASNRSYRISSGRDFLLFLKRHSKRNGGRLDLLLDEVDQACADPEFEYLGHAAKEGSVRLILCGRANLMHFAMNPNSRFSLRLRLLRPGPLESEAARDLLLKPMEEMGIRYESQDCIDHICKMSGRLPFLLQYYSQSLVNMVADAGSDRISYEMIESFENDFETVSFLMSPLADIHDSKTKDLALALLKSKNEFFSVSHVADIADNLDMPLVPDEIFNICNELCIYGVLVYQDGVFLVANSAIRDLAFKLRYI